MAQKTQNPLEWEKRLSNYFEKLEILEGEDLKVYLEILKSQKDLTGKEIVGKFKHLKRTHVYTILKRLLNDGWIEITTAPSKRPANYRGINPINNVKIAIENQKDQLAQLEELQEYINKEVLPTLSAKQLYGGRVSNTFIIPTISELYQQIINHVKQAKLRIMIHTDYDLFFELKDIVIPAISRIIQAWDKKNIFLRDEDRRDRFALIVSGKGIDNDFQMELPERLRIAFDPSEIQTIIVVVDDVVFISNLNTGFGLSLRINDQIVASTYAILLSHIYLEKQINLYGNDDINALGKHMSKERIITNTFQSLLDQGWKIIPEHTNSTDMSDELGLAAPGSERAFFRLCGIRYFPFTKDPSKQEQVQALFEDTFIRGLAYIQRVRKQLKIHGKKDKKKLFGHDCHVYWIQYELREEWVPIIGNVPKLDSINDKSEGIIMATFNFIDKAALSVWGTNPDNIMTILELVLKQF